MIREAEAAKARMATTSGNVFDQDGLILVKQQAMVVNENYMIIGGQIEESLKNKIVNVEYVDFVRLLPRDRLTREEDHRMEIVSKGGLTYFVPVADREANGQINSFFKWEQAFRVFASVYSQAYHHKASELIQYNHLIQTASLSFTWDNVYQYNKEFRLHLSKLECDTSTSLVCLPHRSDNI